MHFQGVGGSFQGVAALGGSTEIHAAVFHFQAPISTTHLMWCYGINILSAMSLQSPMD